MGMSASRPSLDLAVDTLRRAGFDEVGVAPPALPEHRDDLLRWMESGYAASMDWLRRHPEVRVDLRERFPWAASILVATRAYRHPRRTEGLAPFVSTYAQGVDYHDLLLGRMKDAGRALEERWPGLRWHAYVDTGPALERQLAEAAGLGWRAKNGLLLHPRHGSRFFLALLVTDVEWDPTPQNWGSCGSCRACQAACPTEAFVEPGVLDAGRCISYLTIEHRGSIAPELRPAMGQWLFGCDLCQTACPFDHRASTEGDPELSPTDPVVSTSLQELLRLDEKSFRKRFGGTPLLRPKREGLVRNALIVVANGEHEDCLPAVRALLEDPSAVIRETAQWCLRRWGEEADRVDTRRAKD